MGPRAPGQSVHTWVLTRAWLTGDQSAAKYIKDVMDKKYGPQWHVACGEGFGFNVT